MSMLGLCVYVGDYILCFARSVYVGDDDLFFTKLDEIVGDIDHDKFELWIVGHINANTRDRNLHAAKGLFDFCCENGVKRLIEDIMRPNDNDKGFKRNDG